MYAVIEQGGKQIKVAQGDRVNIELMEVPADAKTVELDKVLLVGEGEKVVPVYPVLPSREPEGRKIAFFNPAQDGHLADAAVPGDDAGGEIFRVGLGDVCSHLLPP